MSLQVPDDLTPLFFKLLACVLANQREIMKLLDPSCEQTKETLTMNDSPFSVLLPILKKLEVTPSTRQDAVPVSPVPADVKFEPAPQLSDTGNCSRVDVNRRTVTSVSNGTCAQLSTADPRASEKTVRAVKAEEKRSSGVENTQLGCGIFGDFHQNVAASKKEQQTRRNILLIRGVLDEAVPTRDELDLATSLLSLCSHITSLVKAYPMGTQQNILGVKLDKSSARAVADFFWAN